MRTQTNSVSEKRSGFTLLELLVVIVIIAVLVGLLLPAIFRVFARGAEAEVIAEMTRLDQALQAFQSKFGEYPPSSLTIPQVGDPWTVGDRAKVRAIWPEFDFDSNGGLNNDGVGNNPGEIQLNGAECLVFFLGGLQSGSGTTTATLAGFSKNPQTPWPSAAPPENPDGPFMEFDLGRLSNVDEDSAFEYLDPIAEQTTPYLYISGAGKAMNTHNHVGNDDYDVFAGFDAFGNGQPNMSFCYVQADGKTPHRKNTFQIISPGDDGEYGTGGVYGPDVTLTDDGSLDGTAGVANSDNASGLQVGHFDPLDFVEARGAEADNITNFSDGGPLN